MEKENKENEETTIKLTKKTKEKLRKYAIDKWGGIGLSVTFEDIIKNLLEGEK
jgi:hypothetical protein